MSCDRDYYQGWVKYLANNTCELGYDQFVNEGKASWRKGRQDIDGASLTHFIDDIEFHIWLWGEGSEWWQSDRMKAILASGPSAPICTARRIMRKITDRDVAILINTRRPGWVLAKVVTDITNTLDANEIILVNQDMIGKWLVLSIDVEAKSCSYQFLPNKV